jgi:hypothetical protein
VVDAPVSPEVLGILEELSLVGRNGDRDPPFDCPGIPLALVAVVMGVEDPIDVGDPEIREVIEYGARSEVDEHTPRAVPDHVDIGRVLEQPHVFRQSSR